MKTLDEKVAEKMTNRLELMKKFAKPKPVLSKSEWQAEVGKRLRDEIKRSFGVRAERKFAQRVGLPQGCLSQILNGKFSPSAWTLFNIQTKAFINISWLLTGQGERRGLNAKT